ncbi:MAG: hypothetical protein WAT81_00045 [Candidatus Moraniibacteriota bacterium]
MKKFLSWFFYLLSLFFLAKATYFFSPLPFDSTVYEYQPLSFKIFGLFLGVLLIAFGIGGGWRLYKQDYKLISILGLILSIIVGFCYLVMTAVIIS